MEIQFSFNFTSLLFLSLIIILITIVIRQFLKSPKAIKKLPPGPRKLPLIGHLHHLVGSVPHHAFRDLARKHGPLMHLKLGEVSTFVVSSSNVAKQVLKSVDPACADRSQSLATKTLFYDNTGISFSPYNEYWRLMRMVCITELLSAKNVRSFEHIRRDEADRLIESIVLSGLGKPFNLTDRIFLFTSTITCRAAFGKVLKDKAAMIRLASKVASMIGGLGITDLFPSLKILNVVSWNKYKLLRMRREMDSIMDRLIDEHASSTDHGNGELGSEDLVDVLLRVKKGDFGISINNDNIKAVLFEMFGAGTETSSTTIDWAMVELLRNPRVLEKAQTEIRRALAGKEAVEELDVRAMKYLKLLIKETLRMHPPIPMIPRACREECEVDGYTIALDAKVVVNTWAMGRDPEYWAEPDEFRPERFEDSSIDYFGANYQYLPFGSGKRICPGLAFGMANVELPLAQLLYHFDWALPDGVKPSDFDMTETEGLSAGRKERLMVIPTPYSPASRMI